MPSPMHWFVTERGAAVVANDRRFDTHRHLEPRRLRKSARLVIAGLEPSNASDDLITDAEEYLLAVLHELVFIGLSGRPFPTAVEISALVTGLEPLDADPAHNDLGRILEWLVAGGGPMGRRGACHHLPDLARNHRRPLNSPQSGRVDRNSGQRSNSTKLKPL